MYLEDNKQKIKILDERQLNNNISILCLRQHISCYRPKLITKIENKYSQDQDHSIQIIILDFRLAHFDSLSLKRAVKSILEDKKYDSLAGILISVPNSIDSEILGDSDYVFVENTYCKSRHELLTALSRFSMATTSNWITVLHTFIKTPSGQYASIRSPCFDCPEKAEIEMKRLPTF